MLDLAAQSRSIELRSNFEYYAPHVLKVKDEATGLLVPFQPRIAQRYLHQRAEEQKRVTGKIRLLVLKGRRQGISTYIEGRFYWRTSMGRGLQARILTHEQDATDVLFGMTKRFHTHCPPQLQAHTKNLSAKALTFDLLDSEFLVATAGSKDTGRSANTHLFHGSEVAFWPNAADHMLGIGQTVPTTDHLLVGKDSIDVDMVKLLIKKAATLDAVLDGGKVDSIGDIRELLLKGFSK